jgi:AcrR family transcriptional regulator
MARTPKVVEDRRDQIIDAAMRVFAQKGFVKATNKDIAREAGITPGLIYYYFESKEALLKAIVETRSPVKLMTSLPQQVFTLPPEMFLRFLIRQVLSIVEGENFIGLVRVLLPEVVHGSDPQLVELVGGVLQRVIGFLGNYLEAKMKAGELRQADVSLAAQVILGSVMGFVLRRQILCDSLALAYSQEQVADAVVETVLSGLLPC